MATKLVSSLAETYAGDALGIEWPADMPAWMIGRRLILKVTPHRSWYYAFPELAQDLPEAPGHRGHGLSVGWRRLPTKAEAELPGVYVFDRSAAYLSVCSSVDLPIGTPGWVDGAACEKKPGTGWRVGLWHVTVSYNGSQWNGRELPAVVREEGECWLWTPVLRAALDCGYRVESGRGGILWTDANGKPGQTRVLEHWQRHVWAALLALKSDDGTRFPDDDARRAAIRLVKSVYTKTIGAFKYVPKARQMTSEEVEAGAMENETWRRWYRPEWENLIRAEAVARTFYAARKAVERGYRPMWMYVDNIALASPLSPGETAEAAGLLTKPESCGAWHHEYTAPMADARNPRPHRGIITVDGHGHKLPTVR